MTSGLTPLEEEFRKRLLELFQRVNPRQPERGVRPLIERARTLARKTGIPEAQALEEVYRGALERTERRIALLDRCSLNKPVE